jgi:hypothetical protein
MKQWLNNVLNTTVKSHVAAAVASLGDLHGTPGRDGRDGKDSVALEEVEKLIVNLIGNAAFADGILKKFIAIKKELNKISSDMRYARIGPVKHEIVNRIQQHIGDEE